MKKIALINPGTAAQYAVTEPLNLGFIASYLHAQIPDIEIRIIDQLAGDDVFEKIQNFRPDIVAITGVTPIIYHSYTIADYCRKNGILTILGGVHASILPEEALLHADIVVTGEGEEAIVRIVREKITSGIVTGIPLWDLDTIPPPSRHLMNMNFYTTTRTRFTSSFLNFVSLHGKVAAMLTSRGCPFDCCFCHNSWKDLPYRFHSPERVVDELEDLVKNYHITSVFFIEDNFFVNKPRVRKICELIIERRINITWGANSRVDNIDPEMFKLAKKAGCRQITFGFESGSQRILDLLNKQSTVIQNIEAIKICNTLGIGVNGTVMIGNPTETMEEIMKTKSFIANSRIDRGVGICLTTPYPGTRLWGWCQKHNLVPSTFSWSDFNYQKIPINMSRLSDDELSATYEDLKNTASNQWIGPISISNYVSTASLTQILCTLKNPRRIIRNIKRLRL